MEAKSFDFSLSNVPAIIAETDATIQQRLGEVSSCREQVREGLPVVLALAEQGNAAGSQSELDKMAALVGRIGVARSSLTRLMEEMELFCQAVAALNADVDHGYAMALRRYRSEAEEAEASGKEAARVVAAARILRERLLAQMPS